MKATIRAAASLGKVGSGQIQTLLLLVGALVRGASGGRQAITIVPVALVATPLEISMSTETIKCYQLWEEGLTAAACWTAKRAKRAETAVDRMVTVLSCTENI